MAELMSVEEVEKVLGRSRPSIYRYANTSPQEANLPFNPQKLNPELRPDRNSPLLFHPTEVARFARDVLKIKSVVIEVRDSPRDLTNKLLEEILIELRAIRAHLEQGSEL
ncbi:MAG: resolvase [Cyanobacteria bacterium KgW148]|nr:resolvase [Cyanobacteria bacterium KgW148]